MRAEHRNVTVIVMRAEHWECDFLRAELSIAHVNFMRMSFANLNFKRAELCECEFMITELCESKFYAS